MLGRSRSGRAVRSTWTGNWSGDFVALSSVHTMAAAASCQLCSKPATLKCPNCVKLNLAVASFCSQECFKIAWPAHKLVHNVAAAPGASFHLYSIATTILHLLIMKSAAFDEVRTGELSLFQRLSEYRRFRGSLHHG